MQLLASDANSHSQFMVKYQQKIERALTHSDNQWTYTYIHTHTSSDFTKHSCRNGRNNYRKLISVQRTVQSASVFMLSSAISSVPYSKQILHKFLLQLVNLTWSAVRPGSLKSSLKKPVEIYGADFYIPHVPYRYPTNTVKALMNIN